MGQRKRGAWACFLAPVTIHAYAPLFGVGSSSRSMANIYCSGIPDTISCQGTPYKDAVQTRLRNVPSDRPPSGVALTPPLHTFASLTRASDLDGAAQAQAYQVWLHHPSTSSPAWQVSAHAQPQRSPLAEPYSFRGAAGKCPIPRQRSTIL